MRPKAKTWIEKMGFVDHDLKNPVHDELVLLILANEQLREDLCYAARLDFGGMARKIIDWASADAQRKAEEKETSFLSAETRRDEYAALVASGFHTRREWDKDVGDYVVQRLGPIDRPACERRLKASEQVLAEAEREFRDAEDRRIRLKNWDKKFGISTTVRTEVPITKGRGEYETIIGFLDILVRASCDVPGVGQLDASFWVEVKTTIENFGEVMRQLNTYKHYTDLPICLFLPTPLGRDLLSAFESQGIHVYCLGETGRSMVGRDNVAVRASEDDF